MVLTQSLILTGEGKSNSQAKGMCLYSIKRLHVNQLIYHFQPKTSDFPQREDLFPSTIRRHRNHIHRVFLGEDDCESRMPYLACSHICLNMIEGHSRAKGLERIPHPTLARWLSWLEQRPERQKFNGLIPVWEATDQLMFLSPHPSLFLINKHILGWGFLKRENFIPWSSLKLWTTRRWIKTNVH